MIILQKKKSSEVKDYTIRGIYHKYDLLDGQRLHTKGGGYVIAQEATKRNKVTEQSTAGSNCNCYQYMSVQSAFFSFKIIFTRFDSSKI